jgi:hypothetical protein
VSPGRPAPAGKSNGRQWLILLVVVVVVARWQWLGGLFLVLAYGLVCWRWPIATCGKCGGSGKLFAPVGRAHRPCPRCGAKGVHVRLGAALMHSGDD